MKMFDSQRIRDPIHNLISFEADQFENAMWEALCTAPFQRLRRIKQLGFSDLVYPGATHSRFAHSVGVFHTARQLMQIIHLNEGEKGFQHSSAQTALAAALVHDVGHGPFSHAFEEVGKRLELKLANHEFVSDSLIRDSELSEPLKKLGSGFHNDVADVIGSPGPRSIYDAVVTSQFDADRLDYMRRDRMMAGSSHGVIDYDWLIGNLEVGTVSVGVDEVESGVVQTFVVGPKAVLAAEAYVLGLFQLYPTIYFHKATRGAEKLFTELMVRVFELVIEGDLAKTGLPETHPIVKFARSPSNLNLALQLDDTVVWGSLSQIADSTDKLCSDYSRRLLDRKLLKCFDVRESIKRKMREKMPLGAETKYMDRASARVVEKFNEWKKASKNKLCLFDEASRPPYKSLQESKGPLNQIRVRDSSGGTSDLGDYSAIVRAISPFKLTRFYFDRDDTESPKALENIIDGELKDDKEYQRFG